MTPPRWPSDALGVGHQEQALTCVWCTKGARREHRPFRIEPEVGQFTEDASEGNPSMKVKERCRVLHDDEPRSHCANHIEEPRPSPAGISVAEAKAGAACTLAGRPSADNVNSGSWLISPPVDRCADVVMVRNLRPVLVEDLPAERVDLDLPDRRHAGPLEPQLETAHTREQRQDVHRLSPSR